MLHFTKHALQRMKERGYTAEDVLMVLEGDTSTLVYPSPKESTVDLYFGRAGEKFMMIPVDRSQSSIITVRPMRRAEKNIYLNEVSNA
jgi:hypothetical protein